MAPVIRWRQLVMHTWLWVDCRDPTRDDTSLRSAVWLWIFSTKCHASQFVIVLTRHSNYASEYTPDRVSQVSDRRLLLLDRRHICGETKWRVQLFMLQLQLATNRTISSRPHIRWTWSKIMTFLATFFVLFLMCRRPHMWNINKIYPSKALVLLYINFVLLSMCGRLNMTFCDWIPTSREYSAYRGPARELYCGIQLRSHVFELINWTYAFDLQ